MRQPRYSVSPLRVAGIHDSRDMCYFCDFCDFYIAAVVFPGFREKKRNAAKYPRLYGPLDSEQLNESAESDQNMSAEIHIHQQH